MAQVLLKPSAGTSAKHWATFYVGLGWSVFPVWGAREDGTCECGAGAQCDRPGKHPIASLVPAGVSDATSSRAKVEAWWGAMPNASIGIATGRVSGITVVDADASEGKPGLINLTRICARDGGIPSTFVALTGGGGMHLYFKYTDALRTGANVLDEAIDVRNDGGYVIAPPSTHRSGGAYKWRDERAELKELPDWLSNAPREGSRQRTSRRRGRPRQHSALSLEKVLPMLAAVDSEDRDKWLKMGLLLGRMFVGSEAEGEAWAAYEAWAARSSKFDENRAANIERMREQFYEYSQAEPRAGQAPLGVGTLVQWAREGGWTPFGDRVPINYAAGNEAEMCSAMVAALVSDVAKVRFFNVMGEVRHVERTAIPSVEALKRRASGIEGVSEAVIVRSTVTAALQVALSEKCVLTVTNKEGVPIAKPVPADLATMVLKGCANEFPPLSGVAEWPMVMDGVVLDRRHGYDPETGLYFDIDSHLTIDQNLSAEAAWHWIRTEFFADFPFEDDMAQAGALAMMLAMMQRPLMKTCPAFGVVAPQPGTGKSTLIEICALGIHGVPIAAHPFSTDEEEIRKAIHSLLIAKAAAVLFDNIGKGRAIYSDHLAKLITSEVSADRTLGSSETRREVNSLFIAFTGNNISFVKDLASRVITVKMNARLAEPLKRSFSRRNVRAWVHERRSKLLSALIAIARANPGLNMEGHASRFEDYEEQVVGAVRAVTGVDPRVLESVRAEEDAEEEGSARTILQAMHEWQVNYTNGAGWSASELVTAMEARAFPEATIAAIRRFAGGTQRSWEHDPVRSIGYALRSVRDDYKFHPYVLSGKATKHGVRWKIAYHGSEVPGNGF